jgi:hypothetical protein
MRAYSSLKPANTQKRILVYVESYDDKAFWRTILNSFENESVSFDIQTPSRSSLSKGKSKALERESDFTSMPVGQYLIICIDSDFDYLLQNNNTVSTKVNQSPFIFQTYSYSYENLICYSESLHSVCVQSVKCDQKLVDLVNLLDIYSKITYPLFLWSIFFKYQNQCDKFELKDFLSIVRIIDNVDLSNQGADSLEKMRLRVQSKIQELENKHSGEIVNVSLLGKQLENLGLLPENTYLFIQGHTIKDNVVLMFLKPIVNHLKKYMIGEIKSKAKHRKELETDINYYRGIIVDIDKVLDANTDFKQCFLYKKIEIDLENYLRGFM